jgi:hypothetical protein
VSDVPSDPLGQAAAGGQEPSEEEIRAYLGQLRSAPADQVLAEVSSALANAAQVKLGRQDARLLLDVIAAVSETIRGRVADDLPDQLDEVLTKLRLAQVEAEREVAAAAAQGHAEQGDLGSEDGETDEGGQGAEPPASPGQSPGQSSGRPSPPGSGPSPGQGGTAKRLWTPGG